MKAVFNLFRDHYGQDALKRETTLGYLKDPENNHYCYTLEDVVRGWGIKSQHRTAIPATGENFEYLLGIRNSPKYGEVVVIYTRIENGMYLLEHGGISFSQILAHGGNDAEDTSGCILINANRSVENFSAWGTQKSRFVETIKQILDRGDQPVLRIFNLPQMG